MFGVIYERVKRLQASACDCVEQPYHPPSDLIVTLLELAELGKEHLPKAGPSCVIIRQKPQ